MRHDRIPLFPLNVVLLPGETLPLHIFEPRYREMVRNCLAKKTEFGVLLALPKGIVRVGCTAEIVSVPNRYDDGRMDILTTGRKPFRVIQLCTAEWYADETLLEGYVDYLEDRNRVPDARVCRELTELYEVCHTLLFGDYPKNLPCDVEDVSHMVASKLPLDLLWKQQVLELRCEADRQERLVSYLREWAPHLQKQDAERRGTSATSSLVN
jgi:Lon protease-like protein